MLVSIILVNYNTFHYTCNCIESIIKQTSISDYEIILVDNASNECPASFFKTKYPSLILIENFENGGFAKGNNLGISQSNGEYILLLNSDTELLNDAITLGLNALLEDKSVGVLSGQCLYPNLQSQGVAGRFPTLYRELRELFRINKFLSSSKRKYFYLGEQWDYSQSVEADWVWGAFFMFKKSDLQFFPSGQLHETFFMYGEDMQWCYHFKKVLKKKVVYHPAPKIIHYIGGSETCKLDTFERYKTKIFPNEYKWICLTKSMLYARLFYLVKGLHFLTLRSKVKYFEAKFFLKIGLNGI